MQIIFLITRADTVGGAQIHVRDLAHRLIKDGHAVKVITGQEGVYSTLLSEASIPNIAIDNLKRELKLIAEIRALYKLFKSLRHEPPDLISLHSAKAGVIGRIIGRLLNLPIVFTAHGWSHIRVASKMKSTLFIAIERMLGALGRQRIITVARADKDFAEKTICLPTHKVRLVHNGMNDIWERPTAISLHSIKLVTIARFQKPKDFTTLLKALSELENYNWVIDLIGDGEDMDAVMQIVKDLDLVGRCNFMGRQDNAGKLLSNYNIYLLSSLSEGLPRSIIEAMGAGLPIIASDVGGVKDLVTVGENGFLFEAGNVSDLKYKLEKLLSDVETIEIMGRRSRELYEQNFSFDIMYNKTTDIYAELLSSPPNKDIL